MSRGTLLIILAGIILVTGLALSLVIWIISTGVPP